MVPGLTLPYERGTDCQAGVLDFCFCFVKGLVRTAGLFDSFDGPIAATVIGFYPKGIDRLCNAGVV